MSLSPKSSRNAELLVRRLDMDENTQDGEHTQLRACTTEGRRGGRRGRAQRGPGPAHSSEDTPESMAESTSTFLGRSISRWA